MSASDKGEDKGEITLLLNRSAAGDPLAVEQLIPRIYVELHRIALSRLRQERRNHTWQASELVNEAFIRIYDGSAGSFESRAHFYGYAASIMRNIVVDYARKRRAKKRDARLNVPLSEAYGVSLPERADAIEIDAFVKELEVLEPKLAKVIEMKIFGDFSEEEIAVVIDRKPRTVRRLWLRGQAWLHMRMHPDAKLTAKQTSV